MYMQSTQDTVKSLSEKIEKLTKILPIELTVIILQQIVLTLESFTLNTNL